MSAFVVGFLFGAGLVSGIGAAVSTAALVWWSFTYKPKQRFLTGCPNDGITFSHTHLSGTIYKGAP